MPRGVKGYRWVETGYKVWMLEDRPRHFLGVVLLNAGDIFTWYLRDGRPASGECPTRREAMAAVEALVIPRRTSPCASATS